MFWLIRRIIRDFPGYERPVRLALVVGTALVILALGVLLIGSPEIRLPTLIGIIALVLVLQAAVLWGNRGMVTPIVAAQRAYLNEDFSAVLQFLEPLRAGGTADMRALTLLGNTYRQLGRLDDSERVLLEALDKAPDHHYPLYGFGRTLISKGDYHAAVEAFSKAIEAGAPGVIWLDIAEAHYRLAQHDAALPALERAQAELPAQADAYRHLMAAFLQRQLTGEYTLSPGTAEAGFAYWQAAAERFAASVYGQAVADDLPVMRSMLG